MRKLNTVNGVVSADDVKLICPHEHLFIDMTHEAIEPKTQQEKELFYGDVKKEDVGILHQNPYIVKANLVLDDVDIAVSETDFLSPFGCNLLIDVTSVGLGRDFDKIKEFCSKSDLQVVVGTGLFVHDALPKECEKMSVQEIADWMLDELQNGEKKTGINPGVIGEIGTSEIIYPIEQKSLRAAGIVSVKTDLPIYLHTYPWSRAGLDAIDMLLSEGVKPQNICLCHLDVAFDDQYMRDCLKRGVYLEFDNLGKEFYFEPQEGAFSGGPFETDVARVEKIKQLLAEGYVDQILLANDLCLKASLHHFGGLGYDHVFRNIIPMMRLAGITSDDIQKIIYENPKRFLFAL